ncbi:phytosulfokine receptor 1-like [Panicum miliaceum]|uniref:Phytosulfokine receptor 1-like n=1 Tax=Panicum miliaceum TaxID=4540 RepID=A0A3L6RDL0_PANMI|nr:phytosulfokine receptor 1-like [Panicum miliaceum]
MLRVIQLSLVTSSSILIFSLMCQLPRGVRSCAPADRIALSSFSNNLDTAIHGWPGADNYSDDCCRWLGVRCRRFGAYGGELRVASLDLAGRGFTGALPSTLARLDELRVLNLSRNSLHGALPPELLHMPRLEVLDLSQNNLTGELGGEEPAPPGASGLVHLDVSLNRLTSLRSGVFLGLPRMRRFSAESNQLTGALPGSLSSCSELEYLNMANNSLHGNLGLNLNFSHLTRFPAPAGAVLLRHRHQQHQRHSAGTPGAPGVPCLAVLILTTNFQGEEMPGASAIRGFPSLRLLGIANCALRGAVPPWLRASARLGMLDLSWNRLTGQIPPWLGGFDSLYRIDLSNNALAGEIPLSLARLRSLAGSALGAQVSMSEYGVRLYNWHVDRGQLWHNSNIPPSMDLSRNGLAGAIPPELGDLRALNLSWNALSGPIPATLATLSALQTLELSHNELAGEIPASLVGLTLLSCFDVSHNRLRGLVPAAAQFSTFPCSSFAGNPGLHSEYCDGNGVVGRAQETDGTLLAVGSEMFGLPFWLGMIFGLCATMFVHVVMLESTARRSR